MPDLKIWCLVQRDTVKFPVVAPSDMSIGMLKYLIYPISRLFVGFGPKDLILTKVEVKLDKETESTFMSGQYWPSINDRVLEEEEIISIVWPEEPPINHLHIFISLPDLDVEGSPTRVLGDRIEYQLPHNRAVTHDLWVAVTLNTTAQGRFGWMDLQRNKINLVHYEPDYITEFQKKLGQRRWIKPDTNTTTLKDVLQEFDTYFEDIPTGAGQGDCVSSRPQLWHFEGAFLDQGWKRGKIKEDNVRWIFDKLGEHFQSVLGSRTNYSFQGDWPLSLIVSVETEHRQKEYCYTPQSDFHISVDNLVSLLVEVQSDSHESDRYRMLLQAACMARLGRLFYNKLFIVVALYIDNTGEVTRYFVFQPDDTDWVSCVLKTQTWTQPSELFTAIFELYNLASVREGDRPTHGDMKNFIGLLTDELSANFKHTFMSKRTRDTGEDEANPNKRTRTSHGGQGSNTGNSLQHAEDVYHDGQVVDAFARAGYTLDLDNEEETGWVPLNQLKHTMRYAKDDNGTAVVVKRLRPGCDELRILQDLHLIKSQHNHTIPLLRTLDLDKGTFIVLSEGTPLDYGFEFGRFPSSEILNFSQQLVEGVAFLHSHSIAHLDIKPPNIVVLEKRMFIIDFDIAVRVDGPDTLIDRSRGTPEWMAPEIGKHPDGRRRLYSPIRADLWSCGLVLRYLASEGAGQEGNPYEALTRDLLNNDPQLRPLLDAWSQVTVELQDGMK